MLSLFILAPLAVLIVLNLPYLAGLRKAAMGLVLALSVAQVAAVMLMGGEFWTTSTALQRFFAFTLSLDSLAKVFLLSIGIVMFASVSVAGATVAKDDRRISFFNLLLVAMVGMNGSVLSQDLFSFYVFLEITSVASFILIAYYRDSAALEGAFKYIIMSAVASVMMLGSMALLVLFGGGTSFAAVTAALTASGGNPLAKIAIGGFVCGLLVKGGLVPFHGWLVGAYSAAPAAASVLLAGIVTKTAGLYSLIRLVGWVFPHSAAINNILLLVGMVSIVIGALAALGQGDMKRLLAYSSISQVGYIVLGLGVGTPLALAGAIFHVFNHSVFKSLLFVNAASLEQRLGTTQMDRMGGLSGRMPVTGATSVIASLSAAGVPPLAGFWSKLVIIIALWQAGLGVYAALAVLLSVVTLAYLLLMQRKVFFGKLAADLALIREGSPGLVLPELVLAVVIVGVGLMLPWLMRTFLLPVERIF